MTKTAPIEPATERLIMTNGSAMASFLAAGIGACAVGMFVLLNENGLFAAPALHEGAGGVSGRTTFATAVWLIAWGALHLRWGDRTIAPRPVCLLTLILTGIGILATFPPVWALL
ncbi:MAG: hypothetical protein A3F70_09220 [Acidobacteria bacterium RIFCSPLOWO2_12_FULL_67_14]|nr:MAG: hypothetical protein A3H29_02915 [Acidobacteria bacterium RIFCSPLOWO2_02_FULL_67_21]OFW40718.1 MAG: hypothetical protein A3F70_09220 [Acidobacteria bacterium RIFCSPLOWO2_12_FULL_67_14]